MYRGRRASVTSESLKILSLDVKDVRFPTSLGVHGSDAMHSDPDYSCAYVTITLATGLEGHGLSFTIGRGTELVVAAVNALKHLVVGLTVVDIYKDFAAFWRTLSSESQLRWVGPEKGVIHLATAGIINALWDLWAKLLKKPMWKLLTELDPEQLVSTIDFRYITDALTKEEAIEMLRKGKDGQEQRLEELKTKGYPAYTTQIGWLGYNKENLELLCRQYLQDGFRAFKVKIGKDLDVDKRRLELVRNIIGYDCKLMVDANQVWDVNEAISWMGELAEFQIHWIEEPTSPDDILGHAKIARELKHLNIDVATGEMCANRVLFKQLLQADAIKYCQIDACRVGGVNEILCVYLMAKKFGVKVCPHAGGVGLCEMVQHLQMWDFLALSGTMEDRFIEYVDQQHEHFQDCLRVENAHYQLPQFPGYGTTFTEDALENYEYPNGAEWQALFAKGIYSDPC